ncbi:NUDIX hydrolase [Acetobacteraceae bacterium KSS8]|uniref:NUDIX hydrolase n=1 Tax=Endosaccharibacter trunci TaxID=2812733 RepID=A0ABT1W486_9PROT|nr:NUDIX hydrolase [Acetobacteraceae bacterium KSS8]
MRLEAGFSVRAAAPAAIAESETADRIWAEARSDRPGLFDGKVFVADRVSPDHVSGYWTRYRFLYAQLRHPELFPPPHLRALAVNGVLHCRDGIVLGRRGPDAVYRPGCWQAVPAGSVEARTSDAVDITEQLMAELEEEIGLVADETGPVTPIVAMEHPGGRVVDIGCFVATSLPFAAIEHGWRDRGNTEYDALRVIASSEIPAFLRECGPELLGSARILLSYASGGI